MITYLSNFVAYLREVRGLSEDTITSYSSYCSVFFEYLEDVDCDAIAEVSQRVVSDYIAFLYESGRQASTINVYLNAIRQYFKWLLRFAPACIQMENPCIGIEAVKVPNKVPRFIETAVLRRIVDGMPEVSFKELRSKLVILLGWQCGLRRSEMINLRVDDINLSGHVLRVYGKGRKERFVPMFDEVERILIRYLAMRSHVLECSSPNLLCTVWGDALHRRMLALIVRNALVPHVAVDLAHPHVLRHSYATMLMKKGVPLQAIATVMGHASVATTMRYLSINYDYVRQSIEQAFI